MSYSNSKADIIYAYSAIERSIQSFNACFHCENELKRACEIGEPRFDVWQIYVSDIEFSQNKKTYLGAFLEHGEIEVSNNQVENAIRPAAVGSKNWLFCDTPDGAEPSAVIYSVIETTKATNLNPEKYLAYLLTVPLDCCARDNNSAVDDLMPWQDQIRKACSAEY